MKIFEKLRLKLNKELDLNIPKDAVFERIYAGHHQRSAGAWSWSCTHNMIEHSNIGSKFTATEILKAKKISILRSTGYFPEIWVDKPVRLRGERKLPASAVENSEPLTTTTFM